MGRLFTVAVLNAVAIWVTAALLGVFHVVPFSGEPPYNSLLTYLVLGLLLGLINALLMPVVKIISIPLYLVTLGLWAFVVNGFSLWILKLLSDALGWGIQLAGFWWDAVWAAFVLALVNWVVSGIARLVGVSAKG